MENKKVTLTVEPSKAEQPGTSVNLEVWRARQAELRQKASRDIGHNVLVDVNGTVATGDEVARARDAGHEVQAKFDK